MDNFCNTDAFKDLKKYVISNKGHASGAKLLEPFTELLEGNNLPFLLDAPTEAKGELFLARIVHCKYLYNFQRSFICMTVSNSYFRQLFRFWQMSTVA